MNDYTVLLILEDPQELQGYGEILRRRGYQTVLCSSPGQGINFLREGTFSLLIVGQDAPRFEGRYLLERAHQLHPAVPVLVLARVLDMHYYLDAMDLGAADYMERPGPDELAWAVETQILRSLPA